MTVPFMRAYTELLVATCHRRGAHAIGGMAAFIPSRKDAEVNARAMAKVTEDKDREAGDGFDGTWVAHPDLVPVAKAEFDRVLGQAPHQKHRLREDVRVSAAQLLATAVPGGTISEDGLRNNISVALQYLQAWLGGSGAVGIFNLMEDAATAEIARAQVWQWTAHRAELTDGRRVDADLVRRLGDDVCRELNAAASDPEALGAARRIFEEVALAPAFPEFLTLSAYEALA